MKMRIQSFRLLLVLAMFSSMLHAFVPHSHHANVSEHHQMRHWTANHLLQADWWHELLDLFSDIEHPAAGDDFFFHSPAADEAVPLALEWHFDEACLCPSFRIPELAPEFVEPPAPVEHTAFASLRFLTSSPVRGSPIV